MILLKALLFGVMILSSVVLVFTCMAGLWPIPIAAFAMSVLSYYASKSL